LGQPFLHEFFYNIFFHQILFCFFTPILLFSIIWCKKEKNIGVKKRKVLVLKKQNIREKNIGVTKKY